MAAVTTGGVNGFHGPNGNGVMAAQLTRPPKLIAPRNGKAFQALLVGGYKNYRHEMEPKLLDLYGVNIIDHWDMEARNPRMLAFPRGIEVVVILTDLLPGGMAARGIQCAKDQGLPFVHMSRKMSTWPEAMHTLGLESPPLWLRPALVVEPAPAPVSTPLFAKPAPPATPSIESTKPTPVSTPPRRVSAFAYALRHEREAQGLGKAALADLLGVSHGSIANWETGAEITIRMWLKLVDLIPTLGNTPPAHLARELAAIEAVADLRRPAPEPPKPEPPPLPAEPHERVLAVSNLAIAGAPIPAPPPRPAAVEPPRDTIGAYTAQLAEADRLKSLAAEKRAAAELATREAVNAERQLAEAIEAAHRMHAEIMERLK